MATEEVGEIIFSLFLTDSELQPRISFGGAKKKKETQISSQKEEK